MELERLVKATENTFSKLFEFQPYSEAEWLSIIQSIAESEKEQPQDVIDNLTNYILKIKDKTDYLSKHPEICSHNPNNFSNPLQDNLMAYVKGRNLLPKGEVEIISSVTDLLDDSDYADVEKKSNQLVPSFLAILYKTKGDLSQIERIETELESTNRIGTIFQSSMWGALTDLFIYVLPSQDHPISPGVLSKFKHGPWVGFVEGTKATSGGDIYFVIETMQTDLLRKEVREHLPSNIRTVYAKHDNGNRAWIDYALEQVELAAREAGFTHLAIPDINTLAKRIGGGFKINKDSYIYGLYMRTPPQNRFSDKPEEIKLECSWRIPALSAGGSQSANEIEGSYWVKRVR